MYIILEQTDCFPCGKYKDKLLSDIIKHNASYLCWWHDNFEGYKIHSINKARRLKAEQSTQYTGGRRRYSKPRYNHRETMAAEYWQNIHGHGPH